MVHLTSVTSDAAARRGSVVEGMGNIKIDEPSDDEVSASVYGSRFAAQELPQHEMPEGEMPKEVAYRLIRDDLTVSDVHTSSCPARPWEFQMPEKEISAYIKRCPAGWQSNA